MKELVLLSLIFVGSSYAMDPIDPEANKTRFCNQKTKSGEVERVNAKSPEPTFGRHVNKFCMEVDYGCTAECRCCSSAREKAAQIIKILSRSRE